MAYTSIPDSQREVGKPITKDLLDTIHSNLEDLNTRVASISLAAGSNILLNALVKKPKDSLPIGAIVFGSLTASQVTDETDGGEWVAADGSSAAGSDWATLTGRTTLPDARGRFLRGKANGSGNAPSDPALDAYTADTTASHLHDMGHGHSHSITAASVAAGAHFHELSFAGTSTGSLAAFSGGAPFNPHFLSPTYGPINDIAYALQGVPLSNLGSGIGVSGTESSHSHTINISGGVTNMTGNTGSTGSSETAPRHITENVFIKINRAYVKAETRLFAIRVEQQTIINNVVVTPVVQGASGSFQIDIKKGSSPTSAAQSIFQSGQLPTLAWNGSSAVTGLTDSNQNTVAAGQFIVVSVTATQAKLKEVHIFVGGDY
jgi:hypothetical protein